MDTKPTHEQAQLQMQTFEMRREAKLREAREWFFRNYFAESVEESMRIAAPGTQGGIYTNMVAGYWDQTCALLNYGLLHEGLFFETTGEFFAVWDRLKPVVPQLRQLFVNPHFLEHLEKAAQRFEAWQGTRAPGHLEAMRQFTKQMRAQLGSAAKA